MTPERASVVGLLKSEMLERQNRNSAYSLRAFARDLDTSPAILSLVLQGKRAVTSEKAIRWSDKLKLNNEKRHDLLKAVTLDLQTRLDPTLRRSRQIDERLEYLQIQIDQFSLISDWWHFGLLNLVKLKNTKHNPIWMAKKLGINETECNEALERLVRMGLMKFEEKKWIRTAKPIETSSDIPSVAIQSFHRQNIRRAIESIENVNVNDRDITSIMVATTKSKVEEAKKRIRLFRKELAEFLSDVEADEVYSLNIQLFPQTKAEK
jgi:uncharacterized protein (TIGR02147 family)